MESQPDILADILQWYKDNPDQLAAVKQQMPVCGETFEQMIYGFEQDRDPGDESD